VWRLPSGDWGPRLVGPLLLLRWRRCGARVGGGVGGGGVERGIREHHRLLGPRSVLWGDTVGGHRRPAQGDWRGRFELDPGPNAAARRRRDSIGAARCAATPMALLLSGSPRTQRRLLGRRRPPGPGRRLRSHRGLPIRNAGHRDDVPGELTGLHNLKHGLAEQHGRQRHPPPLRPPAGATATVTAGATELAGRGPFLRRRAAPHPAAESGKRKGR
jgi:hypothetical protein